MATRAIKGVLVKGGILLFKIENIVGGFGRHGVLDLSSSDWFNLFIGWLCISNVRFNTISYIFQQVF